MRVTKDDEQGDGHVRQQPVKRTASGRSNYGRIGSDAGLAPLKWAMTARRRSTLDVGEERRRLRRCWPGFSREDDKEKLVDLVLGPRGARFDERARRRGRIGAFRRHDAVAPLVVGLALDAPQRRRRPCASRSDGATLAANCRCGRHRVLPRGRTSDPHFPELPHAAEFGARQAPAIDIARARGRRRSAGPLRRQAGASPRVTSAVSRGWSSRSTWPTATSFSRKESK